MSAVLTSGCFRNRHIRERTARVEQHLLGLLRPFYQRNFISISDRFLARKELLGSSETHNRVLNPLVPRKVYKVLRLDIPDQEDGTNLTWVSKVTLEVSLLLIDVKPVLLSLHVRRDVPHFVLSLLLVVGRVRNLKVLRQLIVKHEFSKFGPAVLMANSVESDAPYLDFQSFIRSIVCRPVDLTKPTLLHHELPTSRLVPTVAIHLFCVQFCDKERSEDGRDW